MYRFAPCIRRGVGRDSVFVGSVAGAVFRGIGGDYVRCTLYGQINSREENVPQTKELLNYTIAGKFFLNID